MLHASPVATTSPLEAVGARAPSSGAPPNALPPPPSAPHPVVGGPGAARRLPSFKPLALADSLGIERWAAVMGGVLVVRSTGHGISSIWDGAGRVLKQRSSAGGPVVLVAEVRG